MASKASSSRTVDKLTKQVIDGLKVPAGNGDVFIWERMTPGFGVRAKPATELDGKLRPGARSFILQYRNASRRSKRTTLGRYGVLTVEKAREKARHILANKEDPAAAKAHQRTIPTLEQFVERWMDEHAEVYKKPSSLVADRLRLKIYILPMLGKKLVTEIEPADAAALFHKARKNTVVTIERKIAGKKPIKVKSRRGGVIGANRVIALLSAIMSYAEDKQVRLRPERSNPCAGFKKVKEKDRRRKRYLSAAELARLGEALRALPITKGVTASAKAAIRLLIFTGARKSEIVNLRWRYVDFETSTLHLPDSKTGPKDIRLNPPALQVLADRSLLSNGDPDGFVLPGNVYGQPIKQLQHAWIRVRHAAGLDDVRLHDLRHCFATIGVNAGKQTLTVIGELLGHSRETMTARYAHLEDDPVRAANDIIGARLLEALDGPPAPDNKVEFRRPT